MVETDNFRCEINSALAHINPDINYGWKANLQNNVWDIRTKVQNKILYVYMSGTNVPKSPSTNSWTDVSKISGVTFDIPGKTPLSVSHKGGVNAAEPCIVLDASGMLQYISSVGALYFIAYGAFPIR